MAIRMDKIKDGMTLYDRHTVRMGNTTMRTLSEWTVEIVNVDSSRKGATVKWNGNPPAWWPARSLRKLYTWSMHDDGVVVKTGWLGNVISVKKARGTKG